MKRSQPSGFHESTVKHQKTDPEQTSNLPSSLHAPVSPPRRRAATDRSRKDNDNDNHQSKTAIIQVEDDGPSLAAVEAGQVQVSDPLALFSSRLAQAAAARAAVPDHPQLSIPEWVELYRRNQHPHGRHFVIHQHDHPVAGPHYDLRLQFSETSSLSWAIMYGLPGNPNSRRLNRNATETRVHCLWNHLIETGSAKTGSMIIWDTGEYSILPYRPDPQVPETDDSSSDISESSWSHEGPSESEKLREAFQNRKIRLRLHGTRLPPNYTIVLRLSTEDDNAARSRATPRKRRRRTAPSTASTPSTSPSPPEGHLPDDSNGDGDSASASDDEVIDEQTRLTNAYPGATNSIGSIHQRRWFITLDRANSGFEPRSQPGDRKKTWVRKRVYDEVDDKGRLLGFEPFYVRGPEVERSVVTGRTGYEVLRDEGVEGFVRLFRLVPFPC
ncbi:hypothetical protein T310_3375 [Rasamsonia emersonii CBS 393.64]|uniref:DNA ligase D 3'-phosphoesterase domain-containing protein n=1 Tax=Rasamsonia emersonii (strain ATCC 16479 / CBS 393.64 / IMI 116815) TaxID=1408163 RepID=A0A0F4YWG3_RASE3|nr:hypothetical protein T310_3375 [Rasamsonia emersonii CBS 393.64]KKA22584.1 hypothetical protein T310_3375 [Rasamsonia emersonii CBS 393.64]